MQDGCKTDKSKKPIMNPLRVLSEIAESYEVMNSKQNTNMSLDHVANNADKSISQRKKTNNTCSQPINSQIISSPNIFDQTTTTTSQITGDSSQISSDFDPSTFYSVYDSSPIKSKPLGRPVSRIINAVFNLHESVDELIEFMGRPPSVGRKRPKSKNILFNNSKVLKNLCDVFGVECISFTKVTRNTYGKVMKVHVLKQKDVTIEYLKKHICYPRYKTGMSLHLISGNIKPQIIYFDHELYELEKENINDFVRFV